MSIGSRLRAERERLGLTQSQFGELGGVKLRAQINYEAGQRSPDAEYLAKLETSGVDVPYVITGRRLVPDRSISQTEAFDRAMEALAQLQASHINVEMMRPLVAITHRLALDVDAIKELIALALKLRGSGEVVQHFNAEVGQAAARDIVNKGDR